jgi:hypothetical protein
MRSARQKEIKQFAEMESKTRISLPLHQILQISMFSLFCLFITAGFLSCQKAGADSGTAKSNGIMTAGGPPENKTDGVILVERPVFDITTRKEQPPLESMESYLA